MALSPKGACGWLGDCVQHWGACDGLRGFARGFMGVRWVTGVYSESEGRTPLANIRWPSPPFRGRADGWATASKIWEACDGLRDFARGFMGVRWVTGVYSEGAGRTPLAILRMALSPKGACGWAGEVYSESERRTPLANIRWPSPPRGRADDWATASKIWGRAMGYRTSLGDSRGVRYFATEHFLSPISSYSYRLRLPSSR